MHKPPRNMVLLHFRYLGSLTIYVNFIVEIMVL